MRSSTRILASFFHPFKLLVAVRKTSSQESNQSSSLESRLRSEGKPEMASFTETAGSKARASGSCFFWAKSFLIPKSITLWRICGTPCSSACMTKSAGLRVSAVPCTTKDRISYSQSLPGRERSPSIRSKIRLPPWVDDSIPFTFSITKTAGLNLRIMRRYSR